MANNQEIKRYFRDQYGLELTDRQARKFRSVIGDMDEFIAFVSKKMGLIDSDFDPRWARIVLRHDLYPSLASETTAKACEAPQDFQSSVLMMPDSERYKAAVQWLETYVTQEGMIKLRAALTRRSNARLEQHGIERPRKESGHRQSPQGYLLEVPPETISLIRERLAGDRGDNFALRLGKDSKEWQSLEKSQSVLSNNEEFAPAFSSLMKQSISELADDCSNESKDILRDWLIRWSTDEGQRFLRQTLSKKRHQMKSETVMITIKKEDWNQIEKVREKHGFTSLKDALSHIIDSYHHQ